jgi:hypothetical protein
MKTPGRHLSLAALAVTLLLPLAACKSRSNDSADQSAQNPEAAQPAPAEGKKSGEHRGKDRDHDRERDKTKAGEPQQPPPPTQVELPTGTEVRVRLDQDLGSKINNAGDTFQATVADDVQVNGQTVIEKGARADGEVVDAKSLGRFKGGASLAIKLNRVTTRWGSYPVNTASISHAEQGKGKRTGIMVGGGAGLGALIGGLAGGGKGAAIGALAGAGAGTAGSAFTGNKEIVLPAETLLTFTLDHPVEVTQQAQQ